MKQPRPDDTRMTPTNQTATETGATGCREPRPDTLTAADDALLRDLARKIQAKGMSAPAVLWLESLRPVSFLGSQAMHFLNPFVQMLVSSEVFPRLAGLFEERAHLERLLRHIEVMAAADKHGSDPEENR
ncbi:MAG: hypothetical protein ABIF77_13265 [bacterium]